MGSLRRGSARSWSPPLHTSMRRSRSTWQAAGVHTLIEKPLSDTLESAIRIRDAFAGTGLVAAVGHVERFNPAMQSLKRRLEANELGSVISISTRRVGPNPGRVRDVGVVKDLATHDIDLVLWLGGSIDSMWCQLARPLGRVHEDLLEAIGQLRSGVIMSLSVNWVTPTKERSVKGTRRRTRCSGSRSP